MDKIIIEELNVQYSDGTESLKNINLIIPANAISVLFGPSGGGKSTLLRTINRLNDLADVVRLSGRIFLNNQNILEAATNENELRRKVGMVFSRPVPLPLSIYDNVCYGLKIMGIRDKTILDDAVVKALKQAVLWDEVDNRLKDSAYNLSGGQQQRLCIARSLALQPEVILLDEPTSALDPISTARIEALLQELKEKYTIILAPHNTQQATRMADYAFFFLQGELIETGEGKQLFTKPHDKRTQDYVEGRFG